MKKIFFFCVICAANVFSQPVSHYYDQFGFQSGPSLAFQNGLLGHMNPASNAYVSAFDARFYWQDEIQKGQKTNWGFFAGAPGLAFGMHRQYQQSYEITDYSISSGSQYGAFAFGSAYHWSNGDRSEFGRQRRLTFASAWRPNQFLSLGFTGFYGLQTEKAEGVFELGVRPLGSSFFTVFGDILLEDKESWNDEYWSAGAALNIGPGVSIVGRYFGNERFTAGLVFDLGNASVGTQQHFDANAETVTATHHVRVGGMRNSFIQTHLTKEVAYTPFVLEGSLRYQRYLFFDSSALLFADVLRDLKAAADDPRIKVLALNLNTLSLASEHAWEIREMLKYAQRQDKLVVTFIERPMMAQYHLASVADYVILDPMGTIFLPGYLMNPTYLSGTLAKLGLGFDEWRFFKYKSANERFSRESMSDADREQRQVFLDDVYEQARTDIADGRDVSESTVDQWIDEKTVIMAQDALRSGLVDTLARWTDREKIIKNITKKKLLKLDRALLWDNTLEKSEWGPENVIAVVYGIGGTFMESGMNARRLAGIFKELEDNKYVKAIVFRVDSPGGDAMAADIVAQAARRCAKNKPVIISQGGVAASGGYWVSMYGDQIFAGPTTVTGSIGVIGGWIWDDGFSDKLGMTHDYVKRGERADLMAGVSIPLLGRIPARKMTQDERAMVENLINQMYEEFVDKAAIGRDMQRDEVHAVAQGRIWSGKDGLENGLVDQIGGLAAAMEYAKQKAGLEGETVKFKHYGTTLGLFQLFGAAVQNKVVADPVMDYLRLFSQTPLQPAVILPSDSNPYFMNE